MLVLAFFIYGIFNPSWAARLWYNVRTFPQRVTSWISSGTQFLDYDSYKLDVSSVWDKISDKIWLDDEELSDVDFDDKDESKEKEIKVDVNESKKSDIEDSKDSDKKTIKAFPKSINFVEVPKLKEKKSSQDIWVLTWYSKSDILWVINKYIERNLDDDTDILVTVEYDEISGPQKIILETQQNKQHSVSNSVNSSTVTAWIENGNAQYVQNNTSSKLTNKEKKEAEEIYSMLF